MARRWHAAHAGSVHVVESDASRRAALTAEGITCYATLADAPQSDIYLIAIKPQQFADYALEMKSRLSGASSPLILSIMAGITLSQLHHISPHAVRIMPNLPAVIGESMSVACAPALDAPTREYVTTLLARVGSVAWVEDESKLHAATAISGSGPAYLFAFMEALQQAAMASGLDADLAKKLVTQTMRGAALLADQSPDDAATLRAQVTSKSGTTEAALVVFTQGDLAALVAKAIAAAENKSKELAKI